MGIVESDKSKNFSLAEYRIHSYRNVTTILTIILLPFIANTFYQGRYVVGIIASITALILISNIISLQQRNKFIFKPWIVTLSMIPGILAIIYKLELIGILWSYPVLVMMFFVHQRKTALIFSSIFIVCIIFFSYQKLGLEITIRVFATMSMIVIFSNIFLKTLEQQQDFLSKMVVTDPLTGAYNRRYFDERIKLSHGLRNRDIDASIIMLDIDYFKKINDELGHSAGDKFLSLFVKLISHRIRETDSVFRLGGDEFAILLSGEKLETAIKLAEELRSLFEKTNIVSNKIVTCSMGVAELNKDETIDSWMRRGDNALYKAKNNGRNRVELADN